MKLIEQPIELPERYSVPVESVKLALELFHQAAAIVEVDSPEQQVQATRAGIDLQTHIKEVAAARKSLSKPLDEAKSRLIELENAHCGPLNEQKSRLGRLMDGFHAKESERVAKEEKARRDEIERLDLERREAEAKAARARKPETVVKHEQRASEAAEAQRAVIVAPLPVMQKAAGSSTKRELRWTCTDIHKLYASHPELCRVEPNASAIKATCDPSRPIPGLELWFENSTSFRGK